MAVRLLRLRLLGLSSQGPKDSGLVQIYAIKGYLRAAGIPVPEQGEPSFCGLFRVEPNWDELDWSEIFYFHPKLRNALVKKIDESYDGVRPDASSSSEEWDEYREYFVDVLQDIYVEFDIDGTEYELHDVIEPEDLMTFEASDDDADDYDDSDDFDDFDDSDDLMHS